MTSAGFINMIFRSSIFPVVIGFLMLTCSCSDRDEKKEIENVWNEYVIALVADDHKYIAELSDQESINYYEQLAHKIRFADSASLKNDLYLIEQAIVLLVRATLPRDSIMHLSGADLLQIAIATNDQPERGMSHNVISNIVVKGKEAKALATVDSVKKLNLPLEFVKEDDKWKIRLYRLTVHVYPYLDEAMREQIALSGEDENRYLFELVQAIRPIKMNNSLWQPLMRSSYSY